MENLFIYFTTDNISGKKCNDKWLSNNNYILYRDIVDWCDNIDCLRNLEFKRKVYHYINKLEVLPKCICGKYTKYKRVRDGYSLYCSSECCKSSEDYYKKWKDSVSKTFESGNKKRIETLKGKYGDNYKEVIQKNRKFNMLNKYGVENVFQLEDVKVSRKKSLKEKYGDEFFNNSDKTRETRIKNGTQIDDSIVDDFSKYKKIVVNLTLTIYRNNFKLINPNNLKRGKKEYHLDHLFSIKQGFIEGIPIEIITHPCNLHMINYLDNIKKQDECWIDKRDLLLKIISFDEDLYFKHKYLKEKYSNVKELAKLYLTSL